MSSSGKFFDKSSKMFHNVALLPWGVVLPHFMHAIVAGVSTNKHSETFLKFEVAKINRGRAVPIGNLTEQNIMLAVFTEDEFIEFSDYFNKET